ncbi:hypothetical protein Aduo_011609 [Ancylostoma duodenale]
MRGSVMKDFCCVDFLIYVLHLSRDTAIKIMEIMQPLLDESEDIDEDALLLDYCFQSKQRSSKNHTFTTLEGSKTKKRSRVCRGNVGATRILNSTLKEQCEYEFAVNAGGDEQRLEEDLNAQFEKLLDVDQRTFSAKNCETQEDELIHNEGVPVEYM